MGFIMKAVNKVAVVTGTVVRSTKETVCSAPVVVGNVAQSAKASFLKGYRTIEEKEQIADAFIDEMIDEGVIEGSLARAHRDNK